MAGGGRTVTRLIDRLTTPRPMADPVVPRVAFVSPMPPAPTGIATYASSVLEGLERSGYRRRRQMDVLWPIKPKHDLAIGLTAPAVGYAAGVFGFGATFVIGAVAAICALVLAASG